MLICVLKNKNVLKNHTQVIYHVVYRRKIDPLEVTKLVRPQILRDCSV